jgi:NAD(P)-dependent dehydrogenase (short-subunit alcohol dehydrogenase family)
VLHLARHNASRIIIASRNRAASETKAREAHAAVPSFRGVIDVEELDLGSFASVIAFCKRINSDSGRLDVVLANAGLSRVAFKQTYDGYEQVLQVNVLSTGLLALLLLPKLEATARMGQPDGAPAPLKPHLTIVSSEGEPASTCMGYKLGTALTAVHYWSTFPQHASSEPLLKTLNQLETYVNGQERYNVSKLLDVYIAREIAKLPAVTSGAVTVNSVNPGQSVHARAGRPRRRSLMPQASANPVSATT